MSAFHLRKRNLTRYLPQSNRILNLGTAFTFLTAFQLYAGTSYSQTTTRFLLYPIDRLLQRSVFQRQGKRRKRVIHSCMRIMFWM